MAIQDQPGFEDRPYPYQPHGTFLSPQGGAAAPGGATAPTGQAGGLMDAITPMLGSLFAPNQGGGNQSAPPPTQAPPAQAGGVPQYALGPEGDDPDAGQESKAFASGIGQGVLASSQTAAAQAMAAQKKKGMGGMGGMGGGMGGGGGFGGGFTGQV